MTPEGESLPGTQETETTVAETQGSVSTDQKTDSGTEAEETFFDPSSIKGKPELEAAYKDMQRAWTKKTTDGKLKVKEYETKAQAYDAFMANPVPQIKMLAQQYGLNITDAQAQQVAEQVGNGEPQNWDDVYKVAEQRVLQKLGPVLNDYQQTRKQNIEKQLDDNCPDWRQYEDEMQGNLQKHPSLVSDPVKLYQISVPEKVWQSRATQEAMRKLQSKAESAQVSGGSTTNKTQSNKPAGKMSFNEAVEYAKRTLQAQGMKPPG